MRTTCVSGEAGLDSPNCTRRDDTSLLMELGHHQIYSSMSAGISMVKLFYGRMGQGTNATSKWQSSETILLPRLALVSICAPALLARCSPDNVHTLKITMTDTENTTRCIVRRRLLRSCVSERQWPQCRDWLSWHCLSAFAHLDLNDRGLLGLAVARLIKSRHGI